MSARLGREDHGHDRARLRVAPPRAYPFERQVLHHRPVGGVPGAVVQPGARSERVGASPAGAFGRRARRYLRSRSPPNPAPFRPWCTSRLQTVNLDFATATERPLGDGSLSSRRSARAPPHPSRGAEPRSQCRGGPRRRAGPGRGRRRRQIHRSGRNRLPAARTAHDGEGRLGDRGTGHDLGGPELKDYVPERTP